MFKKESVRTLIAATLISLISSFTTYFVVSSKIPRVATVDLFYLHNDFLLNLSKYKMKHGISDEEISKMVVNYSKSIEPLLQKISMEGNIILFQKQAIVTKANDITPQVARAIMKTKNLNQE